MVSFKHLATVLTVSLAAQATVLIRKQESSCNEVGECIPFSFTEIILIILSPQLASTLCSKVEVFYPAVYWSWVCI